MKNKLLIVLFCILMIFVIINKKDSQNKEIDNYIQNIVDEKNVKIDENIQIKDVTENEKSTVVDKDIKDVTIDDEKELEIEEINNEIESFELQNDKAIAYDGDTAKTWNVKLGEYHGLTYYSQIDPRWKNKMHSVIGNSKQTIGSSGCGSTSAAMVVSSIKGNITPDKMADLFLENGYRSENNGTYSSAYRAVADEFNIEYTETTDIEKALQLLENNNYIIVSCGNGLFTTGGHYIVLVGVEGNTLKIYDPYLYNGKFSTSTRRGKVKVIGNTVYCPIENFKRYANYKGFFCYKNEERKNRYQPGEKVVVDEKVNIAYEDGNYCIVDDGKSQFWIHKSVITPDGRLKALGTICYSNNNKYILQVFDNQFWVNENNLNYPIENNIKQEQDNIGQYNIGKYITRSRLNVRSGPGMKYKIKKVYDKGIVFDVKEIKDNWGKTPSGWVCLDYAKKK